MAEYEVTIRRKHNISWTVGFIVSLVILSIVTAFFGNGAQQSVPTSPAEEANVADLHIVETKHHSYTSNSQNTGPSGKIYIGPAITMQSTYANMADDGEKWPEASISFDTDGSYQTLSGVFFVGGGATPADQYAVFRVYADGALIYESVPMNSETTEISFSVNINNASTLTFTAEGIEGSSNPDGSIAITVVEAKVFR